ncbi:NAD(P)H-dependent flavin oxidoreductase [Endozoicomonas numazuensis]|uniref:Monooxygenase n=1 Tax=Endozoicomonas numazuensis TaxID=1137799 RepID=A0A081NJ22_9GAMM|nr:nitronate monooxygenase family protein [Endozoicomonas numazuensis]KEQ18445.1 monooxygenase [Endozoicomonas numazuensis]
MKTDLCKKLGLDAPIFAFTHCRDVVVEVSKAGGIGVFGAAGYTPEQLKQELDWIQDKVGDKPFGIDVIMPNNYMGDEVPDLEAMIPEEHKVWVESVMQKYDIPPLPRDLDGDSYHSVNGSDIGWTHKICRQLLEVAFEYPNLKVMVNALGTPPQDILDTCKEKGILVGALAGKVKHAVAHKEGGLDFVVAQGHEAGGHTGKVTTMVLIPQVVDAVHPMPVLAAGGIGGGRQMAAAMALGAEGVWCGSVWLTSPESEVEPLPKRKLIEATSEDTVQSKMISGKPARMLRSKWTDEWESEECPGALPMPLQGMLAQEAHIRIARAQNEELAFYPTGQIVGMMNEEKGCKTIMYDMLNEYLESLERLNGLLEEA